MKTKLLTSFSLRMTALFIMTVDHAGKLFFPDATLLRFIGRIAMPIFCFLLAESYKKTKNRYLFLRRLLLFALISQIPYSLAFSTSTGNVLFTLALSVLFLMSIDGTFAGFFAYLFLFCPLILVNFCDWGIWGLLFVAVFYYGHGSFRRGAAGFSLVSAAKLSLGVFSGTGIYPHAGVFLALPLLYLYNGERGRDLRFLFYLFYPGHLLLFCVILRAL